MTSSGEMTLTDKIKFDALLSAALRAREFAWLQYRSGIIDNEQLSTEVSVFSIWLGTPLGLDCWAKVGSLPFSEEFVAFVESVLEKNPGHDYWETLSNWK